jgi:hypothetical protein
MSNHRVPAIHRTTHLLFRPEPRGLEDEEPRCVLCGGALDDDCGFGCERCGAPFHGDCHLERAASAPERAIFLAAVAERHAAGAPQLDATMLERLATMAEALALPLAEVLDTIQPPPGPAEQAVAQMTYLCPGCRS